MNDLVVVVVTAPVDSGLLVLVVADLPANDAAAAAVVEGDSRIAVAAVPVVHRNILPAASAPVEVDHLRNAVRQEDIVVVAAVVAPVADWKQVHLPVSGVCLFYPPVRET